MFSMIQVSIGDGWMPYIVRPLVEYSASSSSSSSHRTLPGPVLEASAQLAAAASSASGPGTGMPPMNRLVALFFLLFFFVAGICLLGVVHAILLDEFMVAVQEERQRLKEEEIDRKCITSEKLGSPLDPLLASLAHFHSSSDLTGKIKELFLMIDANGSGSLDYQEICDGLQGLEGFPVKLSLEDLDTITENRALCNEDGELDLASFERLIRYQLQLYVIRILAAAMEKASREQGVGGAAGAEHVGVMLFVLKLIVANMSDFAQSSAAARSNALSLSRASSNSPDCGGGRGGAGSFRGGSSSRVGRSVQEQLDEVLAREKLILDLLSAGAHTRSLATDNSSTGSVCDDSHEGESTQQVTESPRRANCSAKEEPNCERESGHSPRRAPASPRRDVHFAPVKPEVIRLPSDGAEQSRSSPRSPSSPHRGRRPGGYSSSMRVRAESSYGSLSVVTEARLPVASAAEAELSISTSGDDTNPVSPGYPPESAVTRLDDETLAALALADAGLGWISTSFDVGYGKLEGRAGPDAYTAPQPPHGADSEASQGSSMNGSGGEEDGAASGLGPARVQTVLARGSRRSLYSTRSCYPAATSCHLQRGGDDLDLVPALPRAAGILKESQARGTSELATLLDTQDKCTQQPSHAPRGAGAGDGVLPTVAAAAAAAWTGVGGGGLLKVLRYPGQQSGSSRKVLGHATTDLAELHPRAKPEALRSAKVTGHDKQGTGHHTVDQVNTQSLSAKRDTTQPLRRSSASASTGVAARAAAAAVLAAAEQDGIYPNQQA